MEPGKWLDFRTTLIFAMDEAIERYVSREPTFFRSGRWYAAIGEFHVTLGLGREFAEFSFYGVTRDMCQLLVDSRSIQEAFLGILTSAEGVAGVIAVSDSKYLLLAEPGPPIELDGQEFIVPDTGLQLDPDRFTPALVERIQPRALLQAPAALAAAAAAQETGGNHS